MRALTTTVVIGATAKAARGYGGYGDNAEAMTRNLTGAA
jgi:hypothetical protein